jgi:broad specificity phosphatase PhoE
MSKIYFIRHGQASFGASDYDKLSPIGIRQAEILSDHLVAMGIDFDAVYHGSMKRQQGTARPLLERQLQKPLNQVNATVLAAFDEYDARALLIARTRMPAHADGMSLGDLPALRKNMKAFQAYFSQTVYGWIDGHYDGCDGVEPWNNFIERVASGVRDLIDRHGKDQRIAVFTSGGPISVAIQMALGLSHRKTVELSWQIMNASLTCLTYNPAGLTLAMFNNVTHLLLARDPKLLTYR